MKSIRMSTARRAILRALGALCAAAALMCFSGLAPHALAQAKDDKVDKPVKQNTGPLSVGDTAIDQNQQLKTDFLINVSVDNEPDPTGNYKIDSLGNVNIRYAGIMTPVPVLNLTPAQAQDAITKFLKTYIKAPKVSVSIVDMPRPIVFIGGAVRTSGQVIIASDTTLLDALSKAEYTDNADLTQVRIIRKEIVDGKETSVNNYYNFELYIKAPAGKVDNSQNPALRDKDKIFVPYKVLPGAGSVNVYGEVIHPQQNIPLRSGAAMTVREAVNIVGGVTQNADHHRVSIRRPNVDRPLVIDLDKAEQNDLVNNIELKADDSVYVERLENNAYINMLGGYVRPGKIVFDKRTTLTQAIAEAGGIAPFSKQQTGVIYRHPDNDPKHTKIIPFNFKLVSSGKAPDIDLFAGDAVYVETGFAPRPSRDFFDILSGIGPFAYILAARR